ncbi:hypothetical protein [Pseudoalteromonas sp. R3]|uniref:hypothetical protein n=1 Tax=Pseudoalteromonas sp. R3 TaxID=1709477 RepID=UPI0006B54CA5|nr:hypothetical protein [Pseudoalteromonas sp. R3]AZZ98003.1 hypothetical protein ELR70_13295 [Pseudoalteromonas sp. R3]
MSLIEKIEELKNSTAEQTLASQALAQEVAGKQGQIDKKVQDAIDKLENQEVQSFKIGSQHFGIAEISGSQENPYLHLKTNIQQFSSRMVALNFIGFRYGLGLIDTDVSFYVYQHEEYAPKGILHSWSVVNKGAYLDASSVPRIKVSYYFSSDNYLVLVIGELNQYTQVSINSYMPAALRHNLEITQIYGSTTADPQL